MTAIRTPFFQSLAYFGIGTETVYGTAATPTKFNRWRRMDGDDTINMLVEHDGYTRDQAIAAKGGQWHDSMCDGLLYPDFGAAALCWALGGTDVVTGGLDPYTHTFGISDNALPALTVEHSKGANGTAASPLIIFRTPDNVIDQLVIDAKQKDYVGFTLNFKGRKSARQASAATVTFDTDRPFTYVDGAATFTGITVPAWVTNVKLTTKNNADQFFSLGDFGPVVKEAARVIDLEFDVAVVDDALIRQIDYGSNVGTIPVSAPTYCTQLVLAFDLGSTPARSITITIQNFVCQMVKTLADNKAKIFTAHVTATGIRATGSTLLSVVAQNGFASPYLP